MSFLDAIAPRPAAAAAQLEQRVAALEDQLAGAPGTDSLQPNALQVNPDGTLSMLFQGGVVTPTGRRVVEGFPAANQASGIRWTFAGGALVADVEGYEVQAPLGQPVPNVLRMAAAPSSTNPAGVKMTGGIPAALVQALAGALTRRVIDANGASDFVQAAVGVGTGTPQNLLLDGGTVQLTFSGSTLSDTLLVLHSLNRVPLAIVATSYSAPGPDVVPICNTFSWLQSEFSINGRTLAAYTGVLHVCWIAIG